MIGLGFGKRTPWGDFPKVIRNGDLGDLFSEPEYQAAKEGDMEAALNLVDRLLTDETVNQIMALIGHEKPRILPVLAVEVAGNNKIPLAMAEVIADRLGLNVELGIVQREKISRTGAGADHRLAFIPTFEGDLRPGEKYLIVDDTLTMGGTIASLRGYVEKRGGKVIAASVMTAHPGALDLAVKPKMLADIAEKHGPAMDAFWMEAFGYGIDKLTQGEAGHLKAAASADAIRNRIAAARHAGIEHLDEVRTQAAARAEQQAGIKNKGLLEAAQGLEYEQQALLEAAPIERTYQEALAVYVHAKRTQVEGIEDRLEYFIDRQQTRLQHTQANTPGMFTMPSTRLAWQNQQAQEQARLLTLHTRLEAVREIKEGMGLHSPRIEELATRKLRAERPEIAADWDDMREAARRHQILMRKQERKHTQEHQQREHLSRGQTLNFKRPT